MTVSAMSLALLMLATVPVAARHDREPDSPTDKERRTRTVWIQQTQVPEDAKVEIFTGVFLDMQWPNTSAVRFPAPIHSYEYHPNDTEVLATRDDYAAGVLHVVARRPLPTGPGAEVRVTLVDGSIIVLCIITRPNLKDVRVIRRKQPVLNTEDFTRHIGERLSRYQLENELVSDKTRLIADRGSLAVINRSFGDGHIVKQTNGLEITFADVVHDGPLSYLTLIITNHSSHDWPVDLDQVRLKHHGTDVRVISRASQSNVIEPEMESRVVLSYETPASLQEYSVIVENAALFVSVIP